MMRLAALCLALSTVGLSPVVRAQSVPGGERIASCIVDDFVSGESDLLGVFVSGRIGALGWSTDHGVTANRGGRFNPGAVLFSGSNTMKHMRLFPAINPNVNLGIVNTDTPFHVTWVIRRSTTQEPTLHRVGFFDDISKDPSPNGMYFEVRGSGASRTWFAITRAAGTSQEVDSGRRELGNWTTLEIRRNLDAINYYLDGERVGSHTLNLPSVSVFFNAGIQMKEPGNLLIDYFSLCFPRMPL